MICAARTPALVAPGLPIDTVATGTPGGICTVDRSASHPFSADESIGTPITGITVCAATTPARCAAAPAPTMNTLTPRSGASRTSRMTRSGERCAEATVISHGISNSRSTSTAPCMTGASESDPIRIRTEMFDIADMVAGELGMGNGGTEERGNGGAGEWGNGGAGELENGEYSLVRRLFS